MRGQPLDEPVGSVLGADEHERQVAIASELADERLDAVLVRDRHEPVLDLRLARRAARAVLVAHRVRRVAFGEASGFAVKSGGEEQRLTLRGQAATIRSIAGRKPMSSIRSASSRTSILTWPSVKAPRASRSSSRRGSRPARATWRRPWPA